MYEMLADFNLAITKIDRQTAKFNSLPNFLAIQYAKVLCSKFIFVGTIISEFNAIC